MERHIHREAVAAVCFILAATASAAITNTWDGSASQYWHTDANWSLNEYPKDGHAVVIPSTSTKPLLTNATANLASLTIQDNTLTFTNWEAVLNATNVTIQSGGIIAHGANKATATNGLGQWIPNCRVYVVCSNLTVETGGSINADYVGYAKGKGPGADPVGTAGAAHSGPGQRSASGATFKPAYNDPAGPEQPGSGGNGAYIANSGPGGGAVHITATGQITVKGTITADGRNPINTHGGGGSGGSIWLTCRTLAGSTNGLLSVDGGAGFYDGAAGSAGRIAVVYSTNAQAALPEPCPPVRFSGKPGPRDSQATYERTPPTMGTVYLPDTRLLSGALTSKRFQYVRLIVPGFTNWTQPSLSVSDCILGLPDGIAVNVAGNMILTNGAALHLFAKPVADPLTQDGATLAVGGNMYICANSWLLPYADPTNGATVRITVGTNLVVTSGGGIDADDKGYREMKGPGSTPTYYGGGGYGGDGGWGFYGTLGYGHSYGTPEGRAQAGSGGAGVKAGKGGGAIRIVAGGDVTIDGLLTARGSYGLYAHGEGASGGGIDITCRTLQGGNTGLLRADAGQGNYYGACGGGGRIAIRYNRTSQAAVAPPPRIRFSTFAYTNTTTSCEWSYWGGMGTLYLPDTVLLAASPTADATLDAHRFWHTLMVISNQPNSWSPASLAINDCVVRFPMGYRLNVAGDLALSGAGPVPADMSGKREGRLVVQARPTNTLYGARIDVGGDLTIQTNGWLFPLSAGTNGPAGMTNSMVGIRVDGSASIQGGGGINTDGGGYIPVAGNANGPGAGKTSAGGGGYGGIGGGGAAGGDVYGTEGVPLESGSPGGVFTVYNSGKGGGAIHIVAGGNMTVDGTLSANGLPGIYYGGNGASGGSIFMAGRRFSGTGVLRAKGGRRDGQSPVGDGGGGRIAVWHHIAPDIADPRIAAKSVDHMAYTTNLPTFSGQLFVNAGGTNAQAGTSGFYQGPLIGSIMVVM